MAGTAKGSNGNRRFLLIDGNSLTYRAFFALPTDLATASGQVTNAVFGFTSMLINMLRDHPSDGVVVAFDRPEPTFRHERVADYKAGRAETPDILRQQMGLVREVIEVLGITMVDQAGVEADDILATLATQARDNGDDVIVVTGDRDAYQLVEDPHIKVLYNKRGVSDYALYDEAGIEERTGVRPDKYVLYAAMRGDKSDNLPGVPGVGEKTAAKLLNTYGDLDGIFANLDAQTPKLRENLGAHEEVVRENAIVMDLIRDVDLSAELPGGMADLAMGEIDVDELKRLFEFLEFHSLFDRLTEALGADMGAMQSSEVLEAEVVDGSSSADAVAALDGLAAEGSLGIAGSFDVDDGLEGLAVVVDESVAEVLWIPAPMLADGTVRASLLRLLGTRTVAAHDAKVLLKALWEADLDIGGLALDTTLAAYLLDPADSNYRLADLLQRYARLELPDDAGAPEGQLDLGGDAEVPKALLAARAALATHVLAPKLLDALDAQGLRGLNDDIEVPLVRVLAKMELLGVGVDVEVLTRLRDRLTAEADALRQRITDDAGHPFNVNSTKQMREVLFDELGLTPQKKTKTGYSTDAQTLEKMRGEHPIIEHILRYREVEKLRSTYGESLLHDVADDGRIHASFNQTVARTGRLSSENPNLHNIPVRSEMGKEFREAFVPGEGYTLLVADYNQIELRCIAHLAEDPGLIEAFESGTDIHTETAARVFGVEIDEVQSDQRAKAKMVSYGLAYGMEAYGLGQRLNIPTKEAAVILDAYFAAFPNVHAYMDRVVEEAREKGYTETLFGRRRQIPELSSSNVRIRQAGERQAMNAGIQGLAADIFKVALVQLDRALEEQGLATRVILQVHDEIICEVPADEVEIARELVDRTMHDAAELRVPLDVNLAFGDSWASAK
ncbi:DNA polymerase I [Actinospongicola halichondriae]|uniref:DNA polymerase I n=1 Tax=Actinospongicola halichondriae TaxID=3236844 RepID=UPI003D47B281